MAYAFTREGFGEGLFNSVATLAVAAGQSGRVVGVGVPFDASLEVEDFLPYVQQVEGVGTRFLAVTMVSVSAKFFRAMEVYGVLYGDDDTHHTCHNTSHPSALRVQMRSAFKAT
eukprot:2768493-Amphidinium_carterae.1